MLGHVGHFLFQHLFVQRGFSVGRFVSVANSCMYLVLASLFLSDGFLLKHIVIFLDSSWFPFCMDWNLVQSLFTSLWIVLWW